MRRLLHPASLAIHGGVTLLGFAPILAAATATAIASRYGCRLDEGDAHPCVVLGHDLGDLLYGMFVMVWFALGTWPIMIGAVVLWIAVAVVALVRWIKSRKTPDRAV